MLDGPWAVKHTRWRILIKDLEVLLDGPGAVKGIGWCVREERIARAEEGDGM